MRKIAVVLLALGLLAMSGCVTRVGSEGGVSTEGISGLASGYVTLDALPRYNATIFRFAILDMSYEPGELASVDVWPLAGVGVGLIGAWVRVVTIEAGAGLLWYQPSPPHYAPAAETCPVAPSPRTEGS